MWESSWTGRGPVSSIGTSPCRDCPRIYPAPCSRRTLHAASKTFSHWIIVAYAYHINTQLKTLHTQLLHTGLIHTPLLNARLLHTRLLHAGLLHTWLLQTRLLHTRLLHCYIPNWYLTWLLHTRLLHTQLWHARLLHIIPLHLRSLQSQLLQVWLLHTGSLRKHNWKLYVLQSSRLWSEKIIIQYLPVMYPLFSEYKGATSVLIQIQVTLNNLIGQG